MTDQTPGMDSEGEALLVRLRKARERRRATLARLKDTTYRACESISRKTIYMDPERLKKLLEEGEQDDTPIVILDDK